MNDLLISHFQDLINVNFTAKMEESLDLIAEGKLKWTDLLNSFVKDFYPLLQKAQKEMSDVKSRGVEIDIKCELCGAPMVIRFGRNGEFLACSNYPNCKNVKNFTRTKEGDIEIVSSVEEVDKVCPLCGSKLVVKRSRLGGRFLSCSAYPNCNYTESYPLGIPCPKEGCDGEIVERVSKNKKVFYGCSKYPKCDFVSWDMPIKERCPKCNNPFLVIKKGKRGQQYIACPNCSYSKKKTQ